MMETNTNCQAPAASKKEIGDALMMAAVNCAHVIDDDKVVLRRDAGKPGCSLAQLHERLADAMMIAMTARAATATSLVELREHLHGAAQARELIVLAPEAAGALALAMSTGAPAGGAAPAAPVKRCLTAEVVDHCWKMYQQGQGSADHTAKEVFAHTLNSLADWLTTPPASAQALTSAQAEQAPIAVVAGWECEGGGYSNTIQWLDGDKLPAGTKLYTRPQAAQPAAQDSVERQAYDAMKTERDSYKARAESAEIAVRGQRAELHSLREECRRHVLNSKLAAQVAGLTDAEDAQRYRWLRDSAWKARPGLYEGGRAALMIGRHGEVLDAEIDRAILAAQPSQELCSQDEMKAGKCAPKTCARCGLGGPCTGDSAKAGAA